MVNPLYVVDYFPEFDLRTEKDLGVKMNDYEPNVL